MNSQDYDVSVERNVSMVLSDGTQLSSDIYRVPSEQAQPVLLMRQPYGREIASTVVYAQPEYFARAGFIVVIQDVRGRGESEGDFYTFRNEAADGRETIEWAAQLDGADGRVCMYGFSYQAYTQLAVLKDKPKALVAIAPHMAAADLYNGWFYRNGILRLATTLSWGNQMLREDAWRRGATESAAALEKSYSNFKELTQQFPLASAEPLSADDIPSYAVDWMAHTENDDYWQTLDCTQALAESEVAVFHLAGYYDFYSEGSTLAYQCRKDSSKDFFLFGPWKHIPWERWMNGRDFGDALRIDTDAMLVEFFNAQLGRGDAKHQGVQYFVLGKNCWQTASHWPPNSNSIDYHLSSGGNANSSFGDGQLLAEAASDSPSDHFAYDPEVPVTAPGGFIPVWGPVDLKAQQQGNNILVYDSAPFTREQTIVGHAELELSVATTAEATDFVARLSWLRPDGSATFLSMAAAATNPIAIGDNDVYKLKLKFDATAVCIPTGDQLRLDIASSAFPLIARHPNTKADRLGLLNQSQFKRARQTVYHDTVRPSRLKLPTL
ncbi:CocE/NonD family hydrolase [Coraliomargarita sp. SDUM461003]|uniref:CocE/NonD family hydrolase n=1 Tax=Thalassobacterium maritimum TaxID=3041265 RepID=A0ABU1AYR3_9BACT|nr:CocE/NonD family hydrolase [Coraliomargarita sp. SDUM461003]MDQ8208772.1 CocE/NonD family hydrolase [Coraliomargarita sp. SDUM461003]